MATYLGTTAVFEARAGATAGNLGGGGFNPANTHFIANWTATNANTASPVLSSASYSFVAGDVGAWVYVKSGTNWTPGWYQIASVAGGNATLNAAIGAAVQGTVVRSVPNTIAGCATTASPTAGNVGIDYSQQNAAQFTGTDLTGTTTSCTSAANPFGLQHAGNFLCMPTGTGVTAGWYEIVSISGVTATLDRSAGATFSAVTYYLGGAVSLGGSTAGITDAIFFALGSTQASTFSAPRFFIKNGSYTPSASVAVVAGNFYWSVIVEGYNLLRGDRPSVASGNQPFFTMGANSFTGPDYGEVWCLSGTGTGTIVFQVSGGSGRGFFFNCKAKNTSTTASRAAFKMNGATNRIIGCEAISYNGYGIDLAASINHWFIGNYIHDCVIGIQMNNAGGNNIIVINNLIVSCTTNNINDNNGDVLYYGNTLYGAEAKTGVGINAPLENNLTINNIFYGFVTGILTSGARYDGYSDYNCYFNNTTNINNGGGGQFFGTNDLTAVNPSFTSISQVSGTTATSSGTTLTDGGQNFTTAGVVAGRDYLYVISGTGATVGRYGITAVGTTTLTTDNTIGTSSGGNLTYQITIGRNLLPTGAI